MLATVTKSPNPKASTYRNPKRPPLLPSDSENALPRRPSSKQVTSRYLSSTSSSTSTTSSSSASTSSIYSSSSSSNSKRFHSPVFSRQPPSTPVMSSSVRSQSVERKRPAIGTPDISTAARMLVSSTRSLSVSFQGQSFSLPIRKDKTCPSKNPERQGTPERRRLTPARGDQTENSKLMNDQHQLPARKGTPERRRLTPVRGDQSANSKPSSDQHRWPARSRLLNVNSLSRSVDFANERERFGGSGSVRTNLSAGSVLNSAPVPSDSESVSSESTSGVQECSSVAIVKGTPRGVVVPARFLQETKNNGLKVNLPSKFIGRTKKLLKDNPMSSSPPRGVSNNRGFSSPLRGSVRPASPNKVMTPSVASPLRRGMASPTRMRNGVMGSALSCSNLVSTPSVLSFGADVRRWKVGENRFVDAHELRLLYNSHLQWRFVNARADSALLGQRVTTEKNLYTTWVTTLKLRHSVKSKRIELQLLRHNLKLYSTLKEQMLYLDNWDLIDRDHSSSLSGATEALESSTLRLPVSGARADVQSVKDAICSAVDVMQAMASSICSLVIQVEQVNLLLSELANVCANERSLLAHCKDLLSTLTVTQVQDCSLRTHILQLQRTNPNMTTGL